MLYLIIILSKVSLMNLLTLFLYRCSDRVNLAGWRMEEMTNGWSAKTKVVSTQFCF